MEHDASDIGKKPETPAKMLNGHARRIWVRAALIASLIVAAATGLMYWQVTSSRVYVDSAAIDAPQIELAPSTPGILEDVYVQEGDEIPQDSVVARVGNELIKSKVAGTIVSVTKNIGAQVNPNEAVVTMIDPAALRVVGRVDENKGLDRIAVGDQVVFTVDAFGGKQYAAIVDEVAPASRQSGIVFNISDKREVKQFDVKARFDVSAYSELKNGMSARMWIYAN